MNMNFCDGCDTAKHCSNTPTHQRPCQNMERQGVVGTAYKVGNQVIHRLTRRDLKNLGFNSQGHTL